MDQSTKSGMQPLPLGQQISDATTKQPVSAPPSLDEKVDEWVTAHPDDKSFTETPAAPDAQPQAETPATPEPPKESGDAAAPAVTPAVAETPPDVKQPQAQAETPPAEAPKTETPAPEPTRFSLDAKYRFVDNGPEWSGQQIVDALRERQTLIPKSQEADLYREVFDMPAAQAKELWAPNIAWMRQNPAQVQMIASIIDDPAKAAYIQQCSQYWDTPEAQQIRAQSQPQQQPQLQMSPEVEARFKQLEAQNKQLLDAESARHKARMTDRITSELNVAFDRYPFLRDNPQMVQSLLARAYWLNGGDDSETSKGVLDALEMERDLYDSKLAALNTASDIAREAAAPTPPVPPLVGSAGASPQATASPRGAQPKKFGTLDDAVDDWMNHPPAQFR